jgi:hypothetical protein
MVANALMIRLSFALLWAVASEAFVPSSPIARKASTRATKLRHGSFSAKQLDAPLRSITTSLSVSIWSGKNDEPNEPEGKRNPSTSRLKLSGEASEASVYSFLPLPEFASAERIEQFVAPVTNVIDESTGGWALGYANLEPETESTTIGMSFLATNLAYGIAGSLLVTQGNTFLGALTELACIASFIYHFSQLKFGQEGSRIVRLALLVDYFFALSAIAVGSYQLFFAQSIPQEVLVGGGLAITSLGVCWIFEKGLTYIFFHSLWHLFSAYTGYTIGSLQ